MGNICRDCEHCEKLKDYKYIASCTILETTIGYSDEGCDKFKEASDMGNREVFYAYMKFAGDVDASFIHDAHTMKDLILDVKRGDRFNIKNFGLVEVVNILTHTEGQFYTEIGLIIKWISDEIIRTNHVDMSERMDESDLESLIKFSGSRDGANSLLNRLILKYGDEKMEMIKDNMYEMFGPDNIFSRAGGMWE